MTRTKKELMFGVTLYLLTACYWRFVLYGFLKTMVLEILHLVRFERALDPVVIFHSRTKVCQ